MSAIDSSRRTERSDDVVVVTGAMGFIGRHLCRRLATDGATVRAIDLEPSNGLTETARLHFLRADVRDTAAYEGALEGADTVFHLASAHLQVQAPRDWYRSVNVDAVSSLVTACAAAGVRRVVHVSSVGVYGHVEEPPAGEDAPKRPTNEYERTKLLGEKAALDTAAAHGVDLVLLRPGWVYGPGCPRTAKLLRAIRRGRFVFVGSGSNLRHPIYVEDCVNGMLAAQRADASASGKVYLVVGPSAVTVRELVRTAAEVLGVEAPNWTVPRPVMGGLAWAVEVGFGVLRRQPPLSRRSLAFFEHDNAFDGSEARRRLGFQPQVELADGLRRTVSALWPESEKVAV